MILTELITPYYDVLSIPEAVATAYTAVKTIAYILFPLMFVLHVLDWTTNAIHSPDGAGGSNWYKTFFKAIIIFIALAWYRHIFMKIVALCEAIGMCLCDMGKFSHLIQFISEQSYSFIRGAIGDNVAGKGLGAINALASLLQPKIMILSLLDILFDIIENILMTVRYLLLSILYVFGPLAIVLNLFKYTKVILKGWFTSLLQISAWIIILRILQATMVSLQIENWAHQQGQTMKDILPWITICAIYVVLVCLVPLITAKILSGENLGEVGSMAIGAAAMFVAGQGHAAALHGKGINLLLGKKDEAGKRSGGLVGTAKGKFSSWRSSGKSAPKDSELKEQPRR